MIAVGPLLSIVGGVQSATGWQAVDRPTLWWGLVAGALIVVVCVVGPQRRWTGPAIAGVAGLALAGVLWATVTPPLRNGSAGVWWMLVATVVLAASGWVASRSRWLVLAGGSLLMAVAPTGPTWGFRAGAAVATFGLAWALTVTTLHGGAARMFPPAVGATVGLFLCLPDTEAPLAALGLALPLAVWAVTAAWNGPKLLPGASAALAAPLVMTVAMANGKAGIRLFVGGLAVLATLAVWAVIRVLWRARPGPPAMAWVLLALGVVLAAIGVARLAVVRAQATRVVIGSAVGLAGLTLWCLVGELLARRRGERAVSSGVRSP